MDIQLVDIKEEDLELIRHWRNSKEVSQYMYTSDEISADQQKAWFGRIQSDASQKYWLIEYDEKKLA